VPPSRLSLRIPLLLAAVFAVAIFVAARPAAAQSPQYINQTSCISSGFCFTNGNLQTLTVTCGGSGGFPDLASALSTIADRNGPNTINISGVCTAGVNLVGFNRLVIQGGTFNLPPGQFLGINASRSITLNHLILNGGTGLSL